MSGSLTNGIAKARPSDALASSYQWIIPQASGYATSRGMKPESAEDFAHEFFIVVVVHRGLGARLVAAAAGKSALLYKALHDFYIEQLRRNAAERRRAVAALAGQDDSCQPAAAESDREWATTIVREAVQLTEAYFKERELNGHWRAFEARVLRPILHGTAVPPVKTLAKQAGLKCGSDLSAMLQQVRRRFVSHVLDLMGICGSSRDDAAYHITSLLAMLARD